MSKATVAILRTRPETVLDDYERLMHLAGFEQALPKGPETLLKINISWQRWYPACSTTPWQLEGVIRTLDRAGYHPLTGANNATVVVDAHEGEVNNGHKQVLERYGVGNIHLYEPPVKWIEYKPKTPYIVLDQIFPHGVYIPDYLIGKNIVHLPTVKCVHADTEIVLADGTLTRIADMVESAFKSGDAVLLDADGDTRIPARAGLLSLADQGRIVPQPTRYFWRTPLKGQKIWHIRTKTGRQVKVSANHPFLTPHGWRRAAELQVGDRVAIPRQIDISGTSQPLPHLEHPYGRTSTNWITIPEKTSPAFWRWLGYFMAEGWMQPMRTTCRFWWSNADPDLIEDFVALTQQLFGLAVAHRTGQPGDHYFDSLQMQEFFARLGLEAPLNADTKHVPGLLFRCPNDEIAAFLQGYFDGDASVGKTDGLHITSKSERLAREVQHLLHRLGIIAFRRQYWSRAGRDQPKQAYWQISVYGDELVTLAGHLRLRSARKQARLEQLVARRLQGKRPSNWDTIPVTPELFRSVRSGLGFTQASSGRPSSVNSIENGYTQPTRPVLQYFVELFQKADTTGAFATQIAEMSLLARNAIAWDHVVSVEQAEPDGSYLYDFTMASVPNFIGNGIFLHNTHVFTTVTGAMKNAFGGLLNYNRHWTHSLIHETLTDLLMIQKEIHPGIFAVMDGTLAGSGPGPRAMQWHEKNVILASADQVAIDAVSAKIQGFDPMSLKFIRIGHERGLGIGDPRQIEIVGDPESAQENWHFTVGDTFASWGQKLIYWGPLHPFEWLLLRTPIVPWSFWASNTYFNTYWYNVIGKKRVEAALKTPWGQLFQTYLK